MDSPQATSTQAGASIESAFDGRSRIARLFEMTSDLLATISLDGSLTLLNPAWEQLLGWSLDELRAQPLHALLHPEDAEQALAPLLEPADAQAQIENVTTRFLHHDGSWRWLLWSARLDGECWYASAKDVTDRVWLERQALHDPLTHLPNRLLLMDRARQALSRLHRNTGVVALLFIDLDKFKAVNDNLGHDVGDRLLLSVSERLGALMRDSDTVARLGGDEFVILAEDIEDEGEALALGERVLDALEEPFPLGSAEVAILASVGVAVARHTGTDPEAMLREADVAMYRAKGAGGRRMEIFDERLRRELDAHLELEGRLREALPQRELLLAYQPILHLAGGQAIGCEALVRWRPTGAGPGMGATVLPSTFLPSAEDSELIVQIGNWVLHAACAQAEVWRRNGITIPVSVNVSARELTELDLAERVREELAYCRLPGHALCLEISEEAVLRDPERARSALRDIKRLGVLLALDKFGVGQLSFGLPGNLPVDVVKLDRTLVGGFQDEKKGRAMFAAAIALAKEARLTAVAVGIETNRQLALARELDCTVGQGFLLHGPASAERVRLRGSGLTTSAPWRPTVRLRGTAARR
ncbi:MAG TPA: EAL domain-containing protein [Solirubrobacteraceae bacterium]|jgi:diguanylate cyclase (GGDEF)-like protein/PAS domain S-box-containing protein|nr:EAL domain-containing protein [Solirubrobacteraceae bacterium]